MQLPLELWEQVLLKTFALRTVACSLLVSRPERVAYQDLASVCRAWRLIAKRRVWFAAALQRMLARAESRRTHNARVVRRVLDSMRGVSHLTEALIEDGHLSEEEQQRINSQPTLTEQACLLLRVLNNKPPQAFHCFLHSLQNTDQAQLFYLLTGCGFETFLVGILDDGENIPQRLCHISLERPDSVSTIDSTPARVDWGAAACVMGNTLYAVGIGLAHNELWKWNAASDWTRCANITYYRRYHCVAVVDSTLYALGGWADAERMTLNSVEAYNTQTNKWSAAGQLTRAVRWAACVSYDNSIYVFGGEDEDYECAAYAQVYDAAQHKCTLLHNAMPRACSYMTAVVWETYAILLGHETCFVYNFETETWQERVSYKADAYHFGLVVDNQTLYIAGGIPRITEVRSVSVRDVIEDKRVARWTHHATLPQHGSVHVFSPLPMYIASSASHS